MRMPKSFSLSCQVGWEKKSNKKGLQMHWRDILLESMLSELFLWLQACVYRNVCVCAWEGKRNRRRLKWSDSTRCTLLRFSLFFFGCLQEFSSATNQLSPNPQPHTQTQTRSTLVLQLWWPFPSRLRGKPHSISHKTLTGCEGVCNLGVKEQSVTN